MFNLVSRYQSCDILLSQLRNAGQVKNKDEQMKITGDVMVRALFAVNNSGHHKTMGEEDYLKKFSDFVDKKEDLSIDVDETNKYTTRNWRPNSEESRLSTFDIRVTQSRPNLGAENGKNHIY